MILFSETVVTLGICERSECRCDTNQKRLNCRKYVTHRHVIEKSNEADRIAAWCERGHE